MRRSGEIMSLERNFQASLKKNIKKRLPGSVILKTDPLQYQGIPDLLILYKDKHAFLEVKREEKASRRPNQDWYVKKFGEHTFSSFISPENKEEVLDELEQSLKSGR